MTIRPASPTRIGALAVVGIALFAWITPVRATGDTPLAVDLPNGISARIFTSAYLARRTTFSGTRGTIELAGGERFDVITDTRDPAIANKGDGVFHPFDLGEVVVLLGEIDYPSLDLELEVYVLPFPRAALPVTSASGDRLYLSPHVREIASPDAAYLIAHEMGHVFQDRYLPGHARDGWLAFRRIRGIEDREVYSETSSHADRPREIFAEDFRVLFGGPSAHFGGAIENAGLPPPRQVAGLEEFLTGLSTSRPGALDIAAVVNYPNPFNPETVVRVDLDPGFLARGERLTIAIYDVRGALVRDLYGARPKGQSVRVRWDGRDGRGNRVASSVYFAVARAGNARVTRKLLMIK